MYTVTKSVGAYIYIYTHRHMGMFFYACINLYLCVCVSCVHIWMYVYNRGLSAWNYFGDSSCSQCWSSSVKESVSPSGIEEAVFKKL